MKDDTDEVSAVVLRILELMHDALINNVTLSKRFVECQLIYNRYADRRSDIYYRDPALFGCQTHVDRYVDDIACTLGISRSALNVTAVAKGLVFGAFTICRRDGSTVSAANSKEGILISNLKGILSVNMSAVKWVVVVEKEASFRSIVASSFWDQLLSEGVLITGKGYPDLATRAFLCFISAPSPQNGFASPPVYGLADFDPDGLAILSTYKHGSIALAHENAYLRTPQLQWLGLRSEHIVLGVDNVHASQGLLTLTTRDRARARKMLERACLKQDDGDDSHLQTELQIMLMLNRKAELQLLDAVTDGMKNLLAVGLGTK